LEGEGELSRVVVIDFRFGSVEVIIISYHITFGCFSQAGKYKTYTLSTHTFWAVTPRRGM
jgi:hypothetical protein